MEDENRVITATENTELSDVKVVQDETSTETMVSAESKSEEKRCPNCQALIAVEATFCSECGALLKNKCKKCGNEMQSGQLFCFECGSQLTDNSFSENIVQYNKEIADKQIKKHKHKKLKLILSVVLAILIATGIYFGYMYQLRQKVLNYAIEAEQYANELRTTRINMNGVNEAWGIADDSSWYYRLTMKSYARSTFSSFISDVKSADPKIKEMYNNLMECDLKDSYVFEIKSIAQEAQDAYLSLYDSIIVSELHVDDSRITELHEYESELEQVIINVKNDYGKPDTTE